MRFTLTFLILLPFTAVAQNFDYQISTPYAVFDANEKEYFEYKGTVVAVKQDGGTTLIQRFDIETMKEISRKEYEDFGDGFQFESINRFNDKLYIFYSVYDKPNIVEQLFCREIDMATGTFPATGKKIVSVQGKVTSFFAGSPLITGDEGGQASGFGFLKLGVQDKFNVVRSWDETKILIQYRIKPEEKDDDLNKDIIGLCVFDENMNELSSNQIQMPYTEAKMNNLDYTIDNDGNIFILTLIYDNDKQRLRIDGEISYHLEVMRTQMESTELEMLPITLTAGYINDITVFNDADGNMLCAGFYSRKKAGVNADGIVTFKIGAKGDIYNIRTFEIPLEVLNMYATARQQEKNENADEKGKAEFQYLRMKGIMVFEDGSIVLNGEQYFVVESSSTNPQNGQTTYKYQPFYNDILTAKINGDGSLAWMKKLGKRQKGETYSNRMMVRQGGCSYNYFASGGKHLYFFLDNVNNIDLGLDEKPKYHQDGAGGFFTCYVVDDESGTISKKNLFDMRDVKGIEVFQFHINRIVNISETEFIVEVYKKGKEDMLIKVNVSN